MRATERRYVLREIERYKRQLLEDLKHEIPGGNVDDLRYAASKTKRLGYRRKRKDSNGTQG